MADIATEKEVRKLRALIFGECTDNNWEACKANWMRPDSVKWLRERVNGQ